MAKAVLLLTEYQKLCYNFASSNVIEVKVVVVVVVVVVVAVVVDGGVVAFWTRLPAGNRLVISLILPQL